MELNIIKNYGVFTVLLQIVNTVNMKNRIEEFTDETPSFLLSDLEETFNEIDEAAKNIPDLYQRWNKDYVFPKHGYDLIEKIAPNYIQNS